MQLNDQPPALPWRLGGQPTGGQSPNSLTNHVVGLCSLISASRRDLGSLVS